MQLEKAMPASTSLFRAVAVTASITLSPVVAVALLGPAAISTATPPVPSPAQPNAAFQNSRHLPPPAPLPEPTRLQPQEPTPTHQGGHPATHQQAQPRDMSHGAPKNVQRAPAPEPGCKVARRPSDNEIVLAYGAYEGARLAPYSLAGGDRTDSASVRIEPGREKIYLVLTSYSPMVWKIDGDVGRIAHVVATSTRRSVNSGEGIGGTGIIGIPLEMTSFLSKWDCVPTFYDVSQADSITAKGRIAMILGRPPDIMGGKYKVTDVGLPSMEILSQEPRRGHMAGLPFFMSPMYVDQIQNLDVVTAGGAVAYGVLPQEAGLEQLMMEGKITPMGTSGGTQAYRIEKPISNFPSGLSGAHRVTFVLKKGVPKPTGDIGHSCLMDESSGAFIGGIRNICP